MNMSLLQFPRLVVGWLFNLNARQLGFLNLITVSTFFVCGLTSILAIQLDMLSPVSRLLNASLFGKMLTEHGLVMVYLVLVPLFPGVFGFLVLPASVGAADLAMRRTNIVAWLLLALGGTIVVVTVFLGAYGTGVKMVIPPDSHSSAFQMLLVGLAMVAISVLLNSMSILRTLLSSKYRSVKFRQLPLFAWYFLLGSAIMVLIAPIRIISLLQPILQRLVNWNWGTAITGPGTVGYDQVAWLYLGPAIFAIGLFAIGIAFEVLASNSTRRFSSRTYLVVAGSILAFISIIYPMMSFLTGSDVNFKVSVEAFLKLFTIIPMFLIFRTLVNQLTGIGQLWRTPVLLVFASLLFGVIAGALGAIMALPSLGQMLGGTYFSVAMIHIAGGGCVAMIIAAGIAYWWDSWIGRILPKGPVVATLLVSASGLVLTTVPMILLGTKGLPRAMQDYSPSFETLHSISTIGSFVMVASLVVGVIILLQSLRRRRQIGQNSPLCGEFAYASMRSTSEDR